jgi:hypothetical protein
MTDRYIRYVYNMCMVKLLRKLVISHSVSAVFSQARLMKNNRLILLYIARDVLQMQFFELFDSPSHNSTIVLSKYCQPGVA